MDPNKRPETMERITTPALAEAFIAQQGMPCGPDGGKEVLLALSACGIPLWWPRC
jgi:GMP synthase (glutamine-hydrolysing)